jgi:ribosome biogenesis GTPase
LAQWLVPRSTTALVGSSGVGKSSLVNTIVGRELQDVAEVRGDSRGRHTTIRRELITLPGGALIIDTPGIREVRLWRREGLAAAFPEVAGLADECRFTDCGHRREPGCGVRAAVDAGTIAASRLDDYLALSAEMDETDEDRGPRRRR